jgi:hypothetical protein
MVRMLRHCTTATMTAHSHMSKVGSAVVSVFFEYMIWKMSAGVTLCRN